MIINKISKLKNNKYKIILDDDAIITYDDVIIKNNLLYKKTITKELYNEIVRDTKYYDIYNKCVKSIMKRRKSEKEIKEYLDKFDISIEYKDKIINKLKTINLINDKEFTRAYINDKIYLSKSGINKIKNDLFNLDIDKNIIEEEMSNIDMSIFNDRLEKIIIKKINNNHKYSNYQLKNKILIEMVNLGYKKEDIVSIIDNNLKADDDIIEKEFNKIYSKLSKKYTGSNLALKVKQKMLLKGFNTEKINELIENTED